jgi:SAM-dependent methyltransferase
MTTRSIGEADRLSQPIPGEYQYRALHHGPPVQRFWHRNKRLLLDRILALGSDAVVLDVGCGSGNQALHLGASAGLAIGLDASGSAVRFAATRAAAGAERAAFVRATGDAIPLADRSLTAAVLVEVIEHLEDPAATLAEIRRVLAPGGKLVVTTPNYGLPSPWPVLEWLLDHSGKVPRMAGEQHVSRFDRDGLAGVLRSSGFEVERVGSFYLLSPVLALISDGAADALAGWEIARGGAGGALLFAVARRPRDAPPPPAVGGGGRGEGAGHATDSGTPIHSP